MNPNIAPSAEALPQSTPEPLWALVLAAFMAAGAIAFIALFIRTESRIRRVRREFREKRWQVKQRHAQTLYEIAAERSSQQREAVASQRQDISPVHVPVTSDDIRERRKITRLY